MSNVLSFFLVAGIKTFVSALGSAYFKNARRKGEVIEMDKNYLGYLKWPKYNSKSSLKIKNVRRKYKIMEKVNIMK